MILETFLSILIILAIVVAYSAFGFFRSCGRIKMLTEHKTTLGRIKRRRKISYVNSVQYPDNKALATLYNGWNTKCKKESWIINEWLERHS